MSVRTIGRVVGVAAVIGWVAVVAIRGAVLEQGPVSASSSKAMPKYDAKRDLLLPSDYRTWVLAGSSLGLSYSEGGGGRRHADVQHDAHRTERLSAFRRDR